MNKSSRNSVSSKIPEGEEVQRQLQRQRANLRARVQRENLTGRAGMAALFLNVQLTFLSRERKEKLFSLGFFSRVFFSLIYSRTREYTYVLT